jgi:ribosomal-protein-serine acetyltransferase
MYPLGRPQFPPVFDLSGGVLLHAAEPDDAEAVYAVVDANREHLRAWLPWVEGSHGPEDTRAFLEQDAEQRLRGVTATFLIRENGALAGMIGLHDIDSINRSFLIGYWLDKSFEGCGLVTRSCQHLVTVAFEFYEMERAVIRCAVGNTRSSAVPKRLGFVLEGLERHGQRLNGEFVDLEIYSLLSGDQQSS